MAGNRQASGWTARASVGRIRVAALVVLAAWLLVGCVTTAPTRITLAWDDTSNGEQGFTVQRRDGESGEYRQIAWTGPNLNSYTDESVVSGRVYYYRVGAVGTGNRVLFSQELKVQVPE